MKKLCAILTVALLFVAAVVFACFDDDPFSNLNNVATTVVGGHGSATDVEFPGDQYLHPLPPAESLNSYANVVETSFPLTLEVAFSGFVDEQGEQVTEPVTRMCVLYYSTAGKWTILHDIRNPKYTVIYPADERRALFGRYTIPSSLGFSPGQYISVMLYFATENYENFDLDTVLASSAKTPIPSTAIALVPTGNIKPY